jgi:hypothetical protein
MFNDDKIKKSSVADKIIRNMKKMMKAKQKKENEISDAQNS